MLYNLAERKLTHVVDPRTYLTAQVSPQCKRVLDTVFDGKVSAQGGRFALVGVGGDDLLFFVGQTDQRAEIYELNVHTGHVKLVMSGMMQDYTSPAWTLGGAVVALADQAGDSKFELSAECTDEVAALAAKRELFSANGGKWLILLYGDTHSFQENVSVRRDVVKEVFFQSVAVLERTKPADTWAVVAKIPLQGAFFTGLTENSETLVIGTSRGCLFVSKQTGQLVRSFDHFGVFYPRLAGNWLYFCAFQGDIRRISRTPADKSSAFHTIELVYGGEYDCTRLQVSETNQRRDKAASPMLMFLEMRDHCHWLLRFDVQTNCVIDSVFLDGWASYFQVCPARSAALCTPSGPQNPSSDCVADATTCSVVVSLATKAHPESLYLLDFEHSNSMKNLLRTLPLARLPAISHRLNRCPLGDYWSSTASGNGSPASKKLWIGAHAGYPHEAICTYTPLTQLLVDRGFTVLSPNFMDGVAKTDIESFHERKTSLVTWIWYFVHVLKPDTVLVAGNSFGAAVVELLAQSPEFHSLVDGYVLQVPLLFRNALQHDGAAVQLAKPALYVHGKNDIYCDWSKKKAQLDSLVVGNQPLAYVVFDDVGHQATECSAQTFTIAAVDRFVTSLLAAGPSEPRAGHDLAMSQQRALLPHSAAVRGGDQCNYSVAIHAHDGDNEKLLATLVSVVNHAPADVDVLLVMESGCRVSWAKLERAAASIPNGDQLMQRIKARTRSVHLPPIRARILPAFPHDVRVATFASIHAVGREYLLFLDRDVVIGQQLPSKLDFSNETDSKPHIVNTAEARRVFLQSLVHTAASAAKVDLDALIHSLPRRPLVSFEIRTLFDKRFFLPCVFSKPFAVLQSWSCDMPEEIKLDYIGACIGMPMFDSNTAPLLSCLMVTRKRLPFVKVAYQCFANQTYPNKELVVVPDDDPETAAWFRGLGDSRVRVIDFTPPVQGAERHTLGFLRNLSIDNARGEYFTIWDDDDYYHPSRCGTMMKIALDRALDCVGMGHWLMVWTPPTTAAAGEQQPDGGQNEPLPASLLPAAPDSELSRKVNDVRTFKGATAVVVAGYDLEQRTLRLVGYDNTRNALNMLTEMIQQSPHQIHFALLRPHPMLQRTSSLKGPLVLLSALKRAKDRRLLGRLLPAIRTLFGSCDQEVVLAPPSSPCARISSFRAWEPTVFVKRSAAPRYPLLRKREDTEFVQSITGSVFIVPNPLFCILYLYRIHAGNTWGATHFEVMFTLGRAASFHCPQLSLARNRDLGVQLHQIQSANFDDEGPSLLSPSSTLASGVSTQKRVTAAGGAADNFELFDPRWITPARFNEPVYLLIRAPSQRKLVESAVMHLRRLAAGKIKATVHQLALNGEQRNFYRQDHLVFISGQSVLELEKKLSVVARAGSRGGATDVTSPDKTSECDPVMDALKPPPLVIFLFPGQGGNFLRSMQVARDLMATFPSFKRAMEQCDEIVSHHAELLASETNGGGGRPVMDTILRTSEDAVDRDLCLRHACLFSVAYSLHSLWTHLGLVPDVVVGHSLGEFVAAVACGLFSLDEALGLVMERAHLLQTADGLPTGKMIALSGVDRAIVLNSIEQLHLADQVSLAVTNGPQDVVLSGTPGGLDTVLVELKNQLPHITTAVLRTGTVAYHSPLVDRVCDRFQALLKERKIQTKEPRCLFPAAGHVVLDDGSHRCTVNDLEYWARQTRCEVRFDVALENAAQLATESAPRRIAFVEICPVTVVQRFVSKVLRPDRLPSPVAYETFGCDRRYGAAFDKIWNIAVGLYALGAPVIVPVVPTTKDDGLADDERNNDNQHATVSTDSGIINAMSPEDRVRASIRSEIGGLLNIADPTVILEDADFAELGLDSLHAMQGAARLSAALGIDVSPDVLLEHSTINDVIQALGKDVVASIGHKMEQTSGAGAPEATSALRRRVQEVLKQLLNVEGDEDIAGDTDFAELGLDSLHAMQAAGRLGSALGFDVDPDLLLENTTVDTLVTALGAKSRPGQQTVDRPAGNRGGGDGISDSDSDNEDSAVEDEWLPITKMERWYLTTRVGRWMVLHQRYCVENLCVRDLENAWRRLSCRHEMMRSVYVFGKSGWRRHVTSPSEVIHVSLSGARELDLFMTVQALEVANWVGRLCRCLCITQPDRTDVVVLCHHVLMDIMALDTVVLPELIRLYAGKRLSPVQFTFREIMKRNPPRRKTIHDPSRPWKIPIETTKYSGRAGDFPAPSRDIGGGGVKAFPIIIRSSEPVVTGAELRRGLAQWRHLDVSKPGIVLTALTRTCSRLTGQQRGLVKVLHHGRQRQPDWSNWKTVMFTAYERFFSTECSDDLGRDLVAVSAQLRSPERTWTGEKCFLFNYHQQQGDQVKEHPQWRSERLELYLPIPSVENFCDRPVGSDNSPIDEAVEMARADDDQTLIVEESGNGDLHFYWSFYFDSPLESCHQFVAEMRRTLRSMLGLNVNDDGGNEMAAAAAASASKPAALLAPASQGPTVMFCSHSMFSRMNQMLPVISQLARAGVSCIVLGTEEFRGAVVRAGAEFVLLKVGKLKMAGGGDGSKEWVPAHFALWMTRKGAEYLPQLLTYMKGRRQKIDLLLCDSSFWAGLFAAEILRIPVVLLHMGLAVNEHYSWLDFQLGQHQAVADVIDFSMGRVAKARGIEKRSAEQLWTTPECVAAIAFVLEPFQPARETFSAATHFVGPSVARHHPSLSSASSGPDELDFTVPVDPRHSLIFVSLGTIYNENQQFYSDCFRSLGTLANTTVLLVVGKKVDCEALERVAPPNFAVRQFVPQLTVLQKAHIFVTHGGVNSVQEALWFGVPMIVVPQQLDQFVVANRVREIGAGVVLEATGGNALSDAVHEVRDNARYQDTVHTISAQCQKAGLQDRAKNVIMALLQKHRTGKI